MQKSVPTREVHCSENSIYVSRILQFVDFRSIQLILWYFQSSSRILRLYTKPERRPILLAVPVQLVSIILGELHFMQRTLVSIARGSLSFCLYILSLTLMIPNNQNRNHSSSDLQNDTIIFLLKYITIPSRIYYKITNIQPLDI